MTVIPWNDCEIPSSGSSIILLGPWMPMAIASTSGSVWTDCETPATALSEPNITPVAISEPNVTPITWNEVNLT